MPQKLVERKPTFKAIKLVCVHTVVNFCHDCCCGQVALQSNFFVLCGLLTFFFELMAKPPLCVCSIFLQRCTIGKYRVQMPRSAQYDMPCLFLSSCSVPQQRKSTLVVCVSRYERHRVIRLYLFSLSTCLHCDHSEQLPSECE